jgi:hypothetical protein
LSPCTHIRVSETRFGYFYIPDKRVEDREIDRIRARTVARSCRLPPKQAHATKKKNYLGTWIRCHSCSIERSNLVVRLTTTATRLKILPASYYRVHTRERGNGWSLLEPVVHCGCALSRPIFLLTSFLEPRSFLSGVQSQLELYDMSGFEIAGIVLGAWPILIDGLKFYAEERGVSTRLLFSRPQILNETSLCPESRK